MPATTLANARNRADATLNAVGQGDAAVEPLTVHTLGRFAVWRGSARLGDEVWGREKAVDLFQYFLTHAGALTAKEKISEDLWPGLAAEQADRDFKVALNALNDALEPDRPSRTNARYLLRQGPSYGLNPAAPLDLDATIFEVNILTASRAANQEEAIALYRTALELYRGDYLPGQLAKDWSALLRERLAGLFLNAATHLARLLTEAKSHVEAVYWCQRAIAADPLWESAYRLLMVNHLAQGNRARAVTTYTQLSESLDSALGLEPVESTQQLFEKAMAEP